MNERLTITVIGELALSFAGKPIRTQSRKSELLLACLALSANGQMARQSAADLLWSEGSEDAARTSLRQAVMTIKRALIAAGFNGFSAGRDQLSLDLSLVSVDAVELLAAVKSGAAPDLGQLHRFRYAETLFKGLDSVDESFAAWARMQRQIWRDMMSDALQAGFQQAVGKPSKRQTWAKAILAFDPCNEPVARQLMELRADAGDFTGSHSAYNDLANAMREDVDSEPSLPTRQLAAAISLRQDVQKSGLTAIAPLSATPRSEASPVILVSAIPQTVSDAQLAGILAGLRFELVSLLVRFREWSVVDWDAPNAVHRRPAYTILFSGHARDSQYTYSITLRDERDGAFIWSDTFRGGPDTLQEAEETFVRRMASALNIHISADRLRRFTTSNSIPASHFDAWVKAQQLMHRWRDSDDMAAYELLEGIVRDLPAFSPAHSALAQHANGRHIVNPGTFPDREVTLGAFRHASTARLLDPLDAKAHLCLAWTHALLGQFTEAESAFRDSLLLNSNDPWVLTSATHGLAFCGCQADVKTLTARIAGLGVALAAEHWSYLAGIHFLMGDFDASIAASRQVEHGYYGLRTWAIASHVEKGDLATARIEADQLFKALVRAWKSNRTASPGIAGDWLASMFPIKDLAVRRRLRTRLAEAGFV